MIFNQFQYHHRTSPSLHRPIRVLSIAAAAWHEAALVHVKRPGGGRVQRHAGRVVVGRQLDKVLQVSWQICALHHLTRPDGDRRCEWI